MSSKPSEKTAPQVPLVLKKRPRVKSDAARHIELFYLLLWIHNSSAGPEEQNEHIRVWIPDTVIVKYRSPTAWYFNGRDGQVLKKRAESLTFEALLGAFRARQNNPEAAAVIYSFDSKVLPSDRRTKQWSAT